MERENSLPSVPPPPPPVEESNYTVRYGNGAEPLYNDIADDESVEAQHVVYTFAEEKNSKAGRRKWTILMVSIMALLVTIIALGAVYGNQRRKRSQSIAEANESALNANATTIAPVDVTDVLNGDLYVTPGNATDLNVTEVSSNTTLAGNDTSVIEILPEDEEDAATQTEPPTTWVTSRFGQRIFPTEEPEPSGTIAPEASGTVAPTDPGTTDPTDSGTLFSGTRRPAFARFPNRRPNGPNGPTASRGGQSF